MHSATGIDCIAVICLDVQTWSSPVAAKSSLFMGASGTGTIAREEHEFRNPTPHTGPPRSTGIALVMERRERNCARKAGTYSSSGSAKLEETSRAVSGVSLTTIEKQRIVRYYDRPYIFGDTAAQEGCSVGDDEIFKHVTERVNELDSFSKISLGDTRRAGGS